MPSRVFRACPAWLKGNGNDCYAGYLWLNRCLQTATTTREGYIFQSADRGLQVKRPDFVAVACESAVGKVCTRLRIFHPACAPEVIILTRSCDTHELFGLPRPQLRRSEWNYSILNKLLAVGRGFWKLSII